MKLTSDEQKALAFVAALLFLSAAVRLASLPEPIDVPGGGFDLAAHIEATERAVEEVERAALPLAAGERIDPNTASAVELQRLPRVGAALARRIVKSRETEGRFRTVDDLARVSGIGGGMLDRLRPHLELAPGGGAAVRPAGASARPASRGAKNGAVRSRGLPSGGAVWVPTTVPAGAAQTGRGGGAGPSRAETPAVDVNRADVETLMTLPGVGPVLAARIVAWRDSVGPFGSPEAMLAVPGIGPATLERLRPRLASGAWK